MSSLTILCPNARRCKVAVTPGKLLRQVFEEACLSLGYDANSYELQYKGKPVDVGIPFRLSGFANNATLDLVPTEAGQPGECKAAEEVEIALQTPEGRTIRKTTSASTLWQVLIDFGVKLDDISPGMAPSMGYLNIQFTGSDMLKTRTLKSIGVSKGRVLLRYSQSAFSAEAAAAQKAELEAEAATRRQLEAKFAQKKSDNEFRAELDARRERQFDERQQRLQEEAQAAIAANVVQSSFEETANTGDTPATPADEISRLEATLRILDSSLQSNRSDQLVDRLLGENGVLRTNVEVQELVAASQMPSRELDNPFANFKFPETKITPSYLSDVTDVYSNVQREIHVTPPADRSPVVFDRTEGVGTKGKNDQEDVDDGVYETTVADLKARQRTLAAEIRANEQRAFVPRAFIEQKNRERKISVFKNTVIRFLLPGNDTLQAVFFSIESAAAVYQFVESTFPNTVFDLNLFLKEKLVRSTTKNLIDVGLAPKSNIILRFSGQQPAIPNSVLRVGITDAEDVSKTWLSVNGIFEPYNPTVSAECQTAQNKRQHDGATASGAPPPQRRNIDGLPKWLKPK